MREVGTSASFTYTTESSLSGESATLAQLNTAGAEGRRWRGSFITSAGVGAPHIFEKKEPSTKSYTYRSRAQETSELAVLDGANEEGEAGFYYRGAFFFSNASGISFRDFYASVSDGASGGRSIGVLSYQDPAEIIFSPTEAGDYQLEISRTLNDDWGNLGSPQTSNGADLTFAIASQPASCFFRVRKVD